MIFSSKYSNIFRFADRLRSFKKYTVYFKEGRENEYKIDLEFKNDFKEICIHFPLFFASLPKDIIRDIFAEILLFPAHIPCYRSSKFRMPQSFVTYVTDKTHMAAWFRQSIWRDMERVEDMKELRKIIPEKTVVIWDYDFITDTDRLSMFYPFSNVIVISPIFKSVDKEVRDAYILREYYRMICFDPYILKVDSDKFRELSRGSVVIKKHAQDILDLENEIIRRSENKYEIDDFEPEEMTLDKFMEIYNTWSNEKIVSGPFNKRLEDARKMRRMINNDVLNGSYRLNETFSIIADCDPFLISDTEIGYKVTFKCCVKNGVLGNVRDIHRTEKGTTIVNMDTGRLIINEERAT